MGSQLNVIYNITLASLNVITLAYAWPRPVAPFSPLEGDLESNFTPIWRSPAWEWEFSSLFFDCDLKWQDSELSVHLPHGNLLFFRLRAFSRRFTDDDRWHTHYRAWHERCRKWMKEKLLMLLENNGKFRMSWICCFYIRWCKCDGGSPNFLSNDSDQILSYVFLLSIMTQQTLMN